MMSPRLRPLPARIIVARRRTASQRPSPSPRPELLTAMTREQILAGLPGAVSRRR